MIAMQRNTIYLWSIAPFLFLSYNYFYITCLISWRRVTGIIIVLFLVLSFQFITNWTVVKDNTFIIIVNRYHKYQLIAVVLLLALQQVC